MQNKVKKQNTSIVLLYYKAGKQARGNFIHVYNILKLDSHFKILNYNDKSELLYDSFLALCTR